MGDPIERYLRGARQADTGLKRAVGSYQPRSPLAVPPRV
jgi:hypothetical protein